MLILPPGRNLTPYKTGAKLAPGRNILPQGGVNNEKSLTRDRGEIFRFRPGVKLTPGSCEGTLGNVYFQSMKQAALSSGNACCTTGGCRTASPEG